MKHQFDAGTSTKIAVFIDNFQTCFTKRPFTFTTHLKLAKVAFQLSKSISAFTCEGRPGVFMCLFTSGKAALLQYHIGAHLCVKVN